MQPCYFGSLANSGASRPVSARCFRFKRLQKAKRVPPMMGEKMSLESVACSCEARKNGVSMKGFPYDKDGTEESHFPAKPLRTRCLVGVGFSLQKIP